MNRDRILLCLAHMSGNEQKYVKEAFDSNWVVPLGPNVNAFEEDLRRYVLQLPGQGAVGCRQVGDDAAGAQPSCVPLPADLACKEVVALSAGTAAVHLALRACGVTAGDEVIVQSFTFCASSHPVTYLGATPVFVDSERETWNMDPELLEEAIRDRIAKTGRKPKAIVPVYLYGMPAKIDAIMAIADKYGIPVIEDAAEGFGSRYKGRVCGTFGRYGVLSFNGNKMITTSGGGALICPDAEAKRRVMFYATQARESYPYYQHEEIGYNYRMSNICAGIGRGQMTVLDEHLAHHRMLAAYYAEAFADIDGITYHSAPADTTECAVQTKDNRLAESTAQSAESTQSMDSAAQLNAQTVPVYESNYWLSTITLDPGLHIRGEEQAYAEVVKGAVGGAAGVTHTAASVHTDCEPNRNVEALRLALDRAGVESRPLWKPMHRQPVYRTSPAYTNGVSEALFRVGMCLPSGPYVSLEDARYVVDTIKNSISD